MINRYWKKCQIITENVMSFSSNAMVESSAVSYEFMLQVKQLSSLPFILSRFAAKLIAGVLDFKTIIDK